MLINSVVIKLIRSGGREGPDYNITIKGHGSVFYEGKNKVRTKGRLEEPIEKEKIMSLLSEFKSLDFFSLKEVYIMDNSAGSPYTVISLSLPVPGNEKEVKTKNVMFFEEDPEVPRNLKKLANKIDETVESDRWVDFSHKQKQYTQNQPTYIQETKPVASKKIQKKPKRGLQLSKKSLIMIIAIFAILAITIFAISTGYINIFANSNSDGDNDGDDGDNNNNPPAVQYEPPDIMLLQTINQTTAENINQYTSNDINPPTTDVFEQGETVYIYYKFRNVTHGGMYNIVESVNIFYLNAIKDSYSESFENETEYISFYDMCSFETDESWLTGVYVAGLNIMDVETNKDTDSQTNFTIV